jgi:ribosome maturation factor RimP
MISKEIIHQLIEQHLNESEIFVVEVTVSATNAINIFIDSPKGVTIEECVNLSRFIDSNLNREEDDFELQVSSAGLDMPLKVLPQYIKNIGRGVVVVKKTGEKINGIIIAANENEFLIENEKKVKLEGAKKKQVVKENITLAYKDVKSVFVEVIF